MKKRNYIPNKDRAITTATYAVYFNGRREIVHQQAGEPLRDGWPQNTHPRAQAERMFR